MLVVENGEKTHFHQEFAETPGEEKRMLVRFCRWLEQFPRFSIITWNGYQADFSELEKAWHRHGLPLLRLESLRTRHVDLLPWTRSNFRLPTASFKLKEVATYFGFQFRHPDVRSILVPEIYLEYVSTPRKNKETRSEIRTQLLEYNEDDVKALLCVWKKLRAIQTRLGR
jgi:predicted RecB family nuclease